MTQVVNAIHPFYALAGAITPLLTVRVVELTFDMEFNSFPATNDLEGRIEDSGRANRRLREGEAPAEPGAQRSFAAAARPEPRPPNLAIRAAGIRTGAPPFGRRLPQLQPNSRWRTVIRPIVDPIVTAVSTGGRLLSTRSGPTDITGMIDIALAELTDVPRWQDLLIAYRERQAALVEGNPENAGWVPRIRSLEEMAAEQLSQLHGRLIALGLLKFELEGRSSGMSYQVTTLGVRALSRESSDDAEPNDEESDSTSETESTQAA